MVGMANSSRKNTNTSQFFITLDRADELSNKHTLFGKVVGNTYYSISASTSAAAQ
jgi:peptidyl-prolyl cis-trans isomerase SDCCAG10